MRISALCKSDETTKQTASSVPQQEVCVNTHVLARRREMNWQRGQVMQILQKGKYKKKTLMCQTQHRIHLDTIVVYFCLLRRICICACCNLEHLCNIGMGGIHLKCILCSLKGAFCVKVDHMDHMNINTTVTVKVQMSSLMLNAEPCVKKALRFCDSLQRGQCSLIITYKSSENS